MPAGDGSDGSLHYGSVPPAPHQVSNTCTDFAHSAKIPDACQLRQDRVNSQDESVGGEPETVSSGVLAGASYWGDANADAPTLRGMDLLLATRRGRDGLRQCPCAGDSAGREHWWALGVLALSSTGDIWLSDGFRVLREAPRFDIHHP